MLRSACVRAAQGSMASADRAARRPAKAEGDRLPVIDISRLLDEGYDIQRLNQHFDDLIAELSLDYLLIDTHPGLNSETMLAIILPLAIATTDTRPRTVAAIPSRAPSPGPWRETCSSPHQ